MKNKALLILKVIAISLGLIGILVPGIVDYAIHSEFTWTYFVVLSIVYFYAGMVMFCFSKTHRFIKALAVYSVLLLPFLYGIEVVINHFYRMIPQHDFKNYGLPISLIWLGLVWFVILIQQITKMRILNAVGMLAILAVVGSCVTNAISYRISIADVYRYHQEMIQSACYVVFAAICFAVSCFQKAGSKSLEAK